ncbi:MAG: M20/M25/M40 family metallo-hydrolase [Candidatus Kariarchaeaceae archaeon]
MGNRSIPLLDEIIQVVQPLFSRVDQAKEELIKDTIEITEIKAPPFEENNRGEYIQNFFEKLGYETKIDGIGNIIAAEDFGDLKDPVIFSAHLDTVFPESVEIKVKREGDILYAPGVGDDSRGLAVVLQIAKLVKKLNKKYPILFVATVGEEGIGDLRGVKYLFQDQEHESMHPVRSFVTIDGTDNSRIVTHGIGSLRYRVHYNGPGGHSFGAFGQVNPAFALGDFMEKLGKEQVPSDPKTTFSVGVIGGGTSINSIPDHIWADIDLRSADPMELTNLDIRCKQLVQEAAEKETMRRDSEITSSLELLGNRPTGKLPDDSFLLEAVQRANNYFEITTNLIPSSTDANVPLSKGIPAISLASVDKSGRAHSLDEWIDAGEDSLITVKRNLLILCFLIL